MKHIIEQVNVGDIKSGTGKNGKSYTMAQIGLKIQGKWYNQNVFNNDIEKYRILQAGQEFDCELFQEEYNGKTYDKFKVVSEKEKKDVELIGKVDRILKAVELIWKKLESIESKLTADGELPPSDEFDEQGNII